MSHRILSITLLLISAWLCFYSCEANYRHHVKHFPPPCCTAVSSENSSSEVIGDTYRHPKVTHPCVDAIILKTQRGPACFNPKAAWVKKLIANMTKK